MKTKITSGVQGTKHVKGDGAEFAPETRISPSELALQGGHLLDGPPRHGWTFLPSGHAIFGLYIPDANQPGRDVALHLDGLGTVDLPQVESAPGWRARLFPDGRSLHGKDYSVERVGFPDWASRHKADPASREQPVESNLYGPSRVFDPSRVERPHAPVGRSMDEAGVAIYELDPGTFTLQGTYWSAAERLPQVIRELGATMVELQPFGQFLGVDGWGYDDVAKFAVQSSRGGPQALIHLNQVLAELGVPSCADLVPALFGPNSLQWPMGTWPNGAYFNTQVQGSYGPIVNFEDRAVRDYFLQLLEYAFRELGFSAVRIDSTHEVHDPSEKHLFVEARELKDRLSRELGRPLLLIAETNLNDAHILSPSGWGMNGLWSDDFHHQVEVLFSGRDNAWYADYPKGREGLQALATILRKGCLYDGTLESPSRKKVYGADLSRFPRSAVVISAPGQHDHPGNWPGGERLFNRISDERAIHMLARVSLGSGLSNLLFQGSEYASPEKQLFRVSFADPSLGGWADPGLARSYRNGRAEEMLQKGGKPGDTPPPDDPATREMCVLSHRRDGKHGRVFRTYQDSIATAKQFRNTTREQPQLVELDRTAPVITVGWKGFGFRFNFSGDRAKGLGPYGFEYLEGRKGQAKAE